MLFSQALLCQSLAFSDEIIDLLLELTLSCEIVYTNSRITLSSMSSTARCLAYSRQNFETRLICLSIPAEVLPCAGERDAIVRSVANKRLDRYLTNRRAEDPNGLLFVMSDGSKIVTPIDQLNAALRDGGIQRSSFGEKYTIYSLRHFYAVQALRNGIGVFEVVRNMGTSVETVQEYYGKQAAAAVFATRLGD